METIIALLILTFCCVVLVRFIRGFWTVATDVTWSVQAGREAKRKALQREKEWTEETEKLHRDSSTNKGYPEDWRTRRVEVFARSDGRCARCGGLVGHLGWWNLKVSIEKRWHYENLGLRGAHVHHRVPISKGGNHALENLELLCDDCHIAHHPDSAALKHIKQKRQVRDVYLGPKPKFVTARSSWWCDACDEHIDEGQDYFGSSSHGKLCSKCWPKRCEAEDAWHPPRTVVNAAPKPTKRRSPKPTRNKPPKNLPVRVPVPEVGKPAPSQSVRQYDMAQRYVVGDVIEHPTLGRGVVYRSSGSGKIGVMFDGTPRILVHGRSSEGGQTSSK